MTELLIDAPADAEAREQAAAGAAQARGASPADAARRDGGGGAAARVHRLLAWSPGGGGAGDPDTPADDHPALEDARDARAGAVVEAAAAEDGGVTAIV